MNLLASSGKKVHQAAFTVAELLIVILVIGILVGIVSVAYKGVTERAINNQLISDLANASEQLEIDFLNDKQYPVNLDASNGGKGVRKTQGTNFTYSVTPAQDSYCLAASSTKSNTKTYFVTGNTRVTEGVC